MKIIYKSQQESNEVTDFDKQMLTEVFANPLGHNLAFKNVKTKLKIINSVGLISLGLLLLMYILWTILFNETFLGLSLLELCVYPLLFTETILINVLVVDCLQNNQKEKIRKYIFFLKDLQYNVLNSNSPKVKFDYKEALDYLKWPKYGVIDSPFSEVLRYSFRTLIWSVQQFTVVYLIVISIQVLTGVIYTVDILLTIIVYIVCVWLICALCDLFDLPPNNDLNINGSYRIISYALFLEKDLVTGDVSINTCAYKDFDDGTIYLLYNPKDRINPQKIIKLDDETLDANDVMQTIGNITDLKKEQLYNLKPVLP